MGFQYEDLPHWEFTVDEVSRSTYRVLARRDGGIVGEATGPNADPLLADLRKWAQKTEDDLD